jgi:hypothetical protein
MFFVVSRRDCRAASGPFDASVDQTDARNVPAFRSLMEPMEGPREQPPNGRASPCDRRTGRRHRRRSARGPPERSMRPDGTGVLARRTVPRSSTPWVRLATIPPVKVASMRHGVGSPSAGHRAGPGCPAVPGAGAGRHIAPLGQRSPPQVPAAEQIPGRRRFAAGPGARRWNRVRALAQPATRPEAPRLARRR